VKGLTIMLPLTLVTGYFGMNFEYIPLLKEPNGIWYTTGVLCSSQFLCWPSSSIRSGYDERPHSAFRS